MKYNVEQLYVFAIQQPFENALRSTAAYFHYGLLLLVGVVASVSVSVVADCHGGGDAITSVRRCSSHEKWSAFRKWLL